MWSLLKSESANREARVVAFITQSYVSTMIWQKREDQRLDRSAVKVADKEDDLTPVLLL